MKFIKSLLTFIVILVVASPSLADDGSDAKAYVNSVSDRVLAIVKNKSKSDADKEKELRVIFEDTVDANWMGRFVLGRYYKQASAEQKEKYLKLYKEFLVQNYVPRFKEYTGQNFNIIGVKAAEDGQYIVSTELIGKTKEEPAIRVDYRLKKESEFKVIDIVGEGVSLLTTERSDFGGLISQNGIDYFLGKLEEKVKTMKANGGKPKPKS